MKNLAVDKIRFARIEELEQENKKLNDQLNTSIVHIASLKSDIDSQWKMVVKSNQKLEKMPDNFIEWQEKCCCDFIEPRNNHEHSLTCKARFREILEEKQ